jgi:hypothetical protein
LRQLTVGAIRRRRCRLRDLGGCQLHSGGRSCR